MRMYFAAFFYGCVVTVAVAEPAVDGTFLKSATTLREISVALFVDSEGGVSSAHAAVAHASTLLQQQVGVKLVVAHTEVIDFTTHETFAVLRSQYEFLRKRSGQYDLGITFTHSKALPGEVCFGTGCNRGYTHQWRYIHVREGRGELIAHEVGHAFIRKCDHSETGIMERTATQSQFHPRDLEQFLQNKWIDFRSESAPFEKGMC